MPSFNPGMESCASASILLSARKPCSSSFCRPFFSTDFDKLVPKLRASSLDRELLPCRRPRRCVISATRRNATRGDACASPQCWRMQAAFLGLQSASPEVCCWPHWFSYSTEQPRWQQQSQSSSKLSMTPKCEEKVCWSHIWGDKTIPISCLWDAAFSQADYIWIFPQN